MHLAKERRRKKVFGQYKRRHWIACHGLLYSQAEHWSIKLCCKTKLADGACTVLYCTVLYCTVLYCTVLYCTVLYCTVLYCTEECEWLTNMTTSYICGGYVNKWFYKYGFAGIGEGYSKNETTKQLFVSKLYGWEQLRSSVLIGYPFILKAIFESAHCTITRTEMHITASQIKQLNKK
jgi:hypothetical protein